MNEYQQWRDDNDAWFSRADRFDGYDRGDSLSVYDEELLARNEADEAEAAIAQVSA